MKRVIKAQLYIDKTYCDVDGIYLCERIDELLKAFKEVEWDYQCGKAIYKNKEVTAFDLVTVANKISDCEEFYRCFKRIIKDVSGKNTHQIIKLKCDRI